ncbi:hypothetical protein OPQ81_000897 [Rhizoctonia solani]|nr:hypothetical protein OPQ81_000897 [Rhizoctonia solani]
MYRQSHSNLFPQSPPNRPAPEATLSLQIRLVRLIHSMMGFPVECENPPLSFPSRVPALYGYVPFISHGILGTIDVYGQLQAFSKGKSGVTNFSSNAPYFEA